MIKMPAQSCSLKAFVKGMLIIGMSWASPRVRKTYRLIKILLPVGIGACFAALACSLLGSFVSVTFGYETAPEWVGLMPYVMNTSTGDFVVYACVGFLSSFISIIYAVAACIVIRRFFVVGHKKAMIFFKNAYQRGHQD